MKVSGLLKGGKSRQETCCFSNASHIGFSYCKRIVLLFWFPILVIFVLAMIFTSSL